MRKTILFLSFILAASVGFTHAQDVLKKHGFKKKPLTFCDGQYNEFFNNPEVVQIGTTLFNTKTNKVVKLLDESNQKNTYKAEFSSMCIDPHAEKYYSISPYAYANNNPVNLIDPDGRDPRKLGDWWKFAKAVYNASTAVITVGFQGAISGKVGDISVGVNSNAGSFDLVGIRNGNFTPNKNSPVTQSGGELSIGVASFSTNTTKTDNGKTTTVEKKDAASFLFVAEKSQTTTTEIDNTSKETIKTGTQNDLKVPDISIKAGLIVVPEISVNTEKVATAINNLLNK